MDRAVVWAVAQEGVISSTFTIPLRWLFATPLPDKIERELGSPWANVREDARALLAAVSPSNTLAHFRAPDRSN